MMVITFAVGFNPHLDKAFAEGRAEFTERFCLK
jgi:hypothetical protein